MPNNSIDIIRILETKLCGKPVQIIPGQLGIVTVKASVEGYRDIFKVLIEACLYP